MRRTAFGSLPSAAAASSMRCIASGTWSGGRYDCDGIQPSASAPVSRSMRGLYAPSPMPMSCAGAGRAGHPQHARLVRAQPDADVVRGGRAVELALASPELPDLADRQLEV